jgi:hypothetical protein
MSDRTIPLSDRLEWLQPSSLYRDPGCEETHIIKICQVRKKPLESQLLVSVVKEHSTLPLQHMPCFWRGVRLYTREALALCLVPSHCGMSE